MKNKILIFITILLITPIICGLYGVLHDQFTYTISPEYFTKLKFEQFNTAEAIPNRLAVSIVGFKATWWVGLFLGLVLGLTGLIHRDWKEMLRLYSKSIMRVLIVTIIIGLLGLFFGSLETYDKELHWFFPSDLNDIERFKMVWHMHNFSYIGVIIGLIVGVIYQIRYKKRISKK